MIILSCALWSNWLPLLVGAQFPSRSPCYPFPHALSLALTFVLAPLPNAIFSHCGGDDFTTDYEGSGPVDLGRFITATVVVTGFAFPLVLAHSEVIRPGACAMSIVGGSYVTSSYLRGDNDSDLPFSRLVYGTILAYSAAFKQDESDFD